MRIFVAPSKQQLPAYGGVREHMLQLFKALSQHGGVEFVFSPDKADVVHVESSYRVPGRVDAYVCHGGFVPRALPEVIDNLSKATIVISVAEWLAKTHFQHLLRKTIVIHNGVDLNDWTNPSLSYWIDDYILYCKQYAYHMDDFIWLAEQHPKQKFLTTVWPDDQILPKNIIVVGLQTRAGMRDLLHHARFIILAGPEVCPTLLLEAWACGTPVLARYGSGAQELMEFNSPTDKQGKHIIHGGMLYTNRNDL